MASLKLRVTSILAVSLSMTHLVAQARETANEPRGNPLHAEVHADPEKIRAHVRFLASDLLQGRGIGQRGGDIAAEYIATQFALYGLKPAGEDGTYFQDVPLVEVKTLGETAFTFVTTNLEAVTLKNLDDFVT